MRLVLTACLLSFGPTAMAVAAPKPVATSDPAVAVLALKANGSRDVVLANQDGTGARAIYNSREAGITVRAGPASSRTFLMIEGVKLSLLKYRIGASGIELDTITALPVTGSSGDISPDGTLLAYADPSTRSYWTYRFSDGAKTKIATIADGTYLGLVTFTRNNAGLVYGVHDLSAGSSVTRLYRAELAGGDPVDLQISGQLTEFTTAPDGSVYTSRSGSTAMDFVIERWSAAGAPAAYVTTGNRPTLSCDGTQLMFQTGASSAKLIAVLRKDLGTGSQFTFSKTGYYAPEYLGC